MDTIGVVCEPEHPVFGVAAERLAARGFEVEFLPPAEPVGAGALADVDALANTVLSPASLGLLRAAERAGVETWNGFGVTTALANRLVALEALEAVGCRVPAVRFSRPDAGFVPRRRFRLDRLGVDDRVYLERVGSEGVVDRYYAIDDGVETHVQALTVKTALPDQGRVIGETDVNVELATRVRELLDRFDARALRVDVATGPDGPFAVDVDPAPAFFATGLDRQVADSFASLATIGA